MLRRQFLNRVAAGVCGGAAIHFGGGLAMGGSIPRWQPAARLKAPIPTRNTARNLIFLLLEGGPSHVDTFDLKTGAETPSFLGAQDLGGFLWPAGTMPQLAEMSDRFTLVRSLTAAEAVHERAVYHLTTAHRHDASRVSEIPSIASVMSYKLAAERRVEDSLPTVVLFGAPMAQNGFFPIEHRGLSLRNDGQVPNLQHEFEGGEARFKLFNRLLDEMGEVTDGRMERIRIQDQAQQLMNDTELQEILGPPAEENDRERGGYRAEGFRRQCEAVVRLLDADKGTRVVQMFLGGWDHHVNIYNQNPFSLSGLSMAMDDGLAYLIQNLDALPGKTGAGTLLDETLIVAVGEFGRTTGALNESNGRDHYPYAMSAFFAGGGVKPGRIIGATNQNGSTITDPGWSQPRYMGIGDLAASLYSAMGVDWTERFTETPSGRLFEIIPTNRSGEVYEIDALFA